MDWSALIASPPPLAQIPPSLRSAAEQRQVETGQSLLRIGDRVRRMFCVLTGELRLMRRDRNGTEMIQQRSRGGCIAQASLSSKAYHCDPVVAENGVVLST